MNTIVFMEYPNGRWISEQEDGYYVHINERSTLPTIFTTPLHAQRAMEKYISEEMLIQEKRDAGEIKTGGKRKEK